MMQANPKKVQDTPGALNSSAFTPEKKKKKKTDHPRNMKNL
jgi:hypothetical protein